MRPVLYLLGYSYFWGNGSYSSSGIRCICERNSKMLIVEANEKRDIKHPKK